jgi:hypothetical protein
MNSLYMHGVHVNFHFSLSCLFLKRRSPRPVAAAESHINSLPSQPSDSSAPLQKLQPPPSLTIPICSSSSTDDNQSNLTRHSFTTAMGCSNSKNHRSAHRLNIKWLHRTELSTPHLLPPPFAILHGSPTGTTLTTEPPPLILTAEPSMLTTSASIRCWFAPLRP